MKRSLITIVAGAAGLSITAGAFAQRTLQFDINNLGYQFHDPSGAPAPFPGLTATGTFALFDSVPTTTLAGILIRNGGPGNPFVTQSYTGSMTDVQISIN